MSDSTGISWTDSTCIVEVFTHVHAPAMVKSGRVETEAPRWCFGCRKRLPGTWTQWAIADPMEDYYGPHWAFTCDGCGEDRRLGFGMGWE